MSSITGVAGAVAVVLAVSTGCTNSTAEDTDAGRLGRSADDSALSRADRIFVENAVASGQREVELAKAAAAAASSTAIRQYATRLVAAHAAANDQLQAIIQRKGLSLSDRPDDSGGRGGVHVPGDATTATKDGGAPKGLAHPTGTTGASGTVATTGEAKDRERAGMTDAWMHTSGAAFDDGYVDAQIKAHQDAIALFHQQTEIGSDAELKAFAAGHLPALRDHLREAHELKQTLRNTP